MYRLFLTPGWFNGWDLVFEGVGLLIALVIAGYSWRIYKLSNEGKFRYFSLAFILVSLAFLSKIITQGLIYYMPLRNVATSMLAPMVGMAKSGVNYSELFFRGGFFASMACMLWAWLLIFLISQKSRERLNKFYEVAQIALFIYLVALIAIVSSFKPFVFYLTSTVILGLVVLNYYKNYLNTDGSKKAWLVMNSFLLILISQFFFVFVFWWQELYVFGEVFLLVGFLVLLHVYRKVTKVVY